MNDDDVVEAAGEFAEVDPPHRLVFTWGWTHDHAVPPGTTRVVVTLHAENGGTRVVLRHHDLPDQEQRGHHRKGWELYLGRLDLRIRVSIPARTRTPDQGRHARRAVSGPGPGVADSGRVGCSGPRAAGQD
jgi:hypothetical protein